MDTRVTEFNPGKFRVTGKVPSVAFTHVVLIDDDQEPIPIHDKIWELFFGEKLSNPNNHSIFLPVIDLRRRGAYMHPFIHYMYTRDPLYLYDAWLGPCTDESTESMSPDREAELYAGCRKMTEKFLQMAKAWGVKDNHLSRDLLAFHRKFSKWETLCEVCASIIPLCRGSQQDFL